MKGGYSRSTVRIAVTLFVALLLTTSAAHAQVSSQGPNSPGTVVSDSSIGTAPWSNPSDAVSSNNVYAQAIVQPAPDDITEYLKATGFGFSLPSTAFIRGIQVEIERFSLLGFIQDHAVRIVKGGVIGSEDRSAGGAWPSVDTYASYGGSSDLWGETWSASDINSSGFGAALSGADTSADIGSVDHIRITVSYSLCGDGLVSAPEEQCDDGNTANGDCCSSSCQYEPNGNPCTSDGNVCTDDTCNATGTCQHTNNTGPCPDDGNVCTDDVCSGGACTHPNNTGPCPDDGDVCTDDVCSGGACTHPDNTAPCDDGDPCTSGDVCAAGVCAGSGICVDAYKCYLARDLKNPRFTRVDGVSTSDDFSTQSVDVKRPKYVCNPAGLDGAPINNPGLYLTCYLIKAASLAPRPSVEVSTQFQTSKFELKKGKLICAPSTQTSVP